MLLDFCAALDEVKNEWEEKFSKNIGGITQCLFTLFAIISVRFFEKRMVKLV